MKESKTLRVGTIVLASLLVLAGAAWGDTYTITSENATDALKHSINEAGYASTWSSYMYWGSNWNAIQFDLSHDSGESVSSVTSASLQLTLNLVSTTGTISIWRLTETIDEANPDYYEIGEYPSHATTPVITLNVSSLTVNVPYSIDVSSMLANNGSTQTIGFLLKDEGSTNLRIYSKNSGNNNYVPKFSAVYDTIPEPATMGLLAVGSLMFSLRRKR